MRRTMQGGPIHRISAIVTEEPTGKGTIPWNDMGIFDAETINDRKLKSLLCDRGTVKNCRGCESQCAYGREYVRRADTCKQVESTRPR